MRKEFRDSINTALHNPSLTGALGRFSEAYRISREKAYEGIDFEAVRTRIAEIKSYGPSAASASASSGSGGTRQSQANRSNIGTCLACRSNRLPTAKATPPLILTNSPTDSRRRPKPAEPRYFEPTIPPRSATIFSIWRGRTA